MFKYIDNKELKKELKATIIKNNYTQKEVAEKLGMLPQTFTTLINKTNFSFGDMQRILNVLDYDLIVCNLA